MEYVCPNCGYIGKPIKQMKGSFFIELILWLLMIIPGLIYSIWRYTSYYKACPKCGYEYMVPVQSQRGKQLVKDFGINKDTNSESYSQSTSHKMVDEKNKEVPIDEITKGNENYNENSAKNESRLDNIEKLEKLSNLLEKGYLSKEEFEAQKRELLKLPS